MGVSVMRVLPELGLNTRSSGSTPDAVTALLIAPGTRLRAALYRESGLVRRRSAEAQLSGRVLPVMPPKPTTTAAPGIGQVGK
jgi:hypothetical protein